MVDEEGALSQAKWLDHNKFKAPGPLFGMPVGIKDLFDVWGFPTQSGIRGWTTEVAKKDSTLVTRLRKAGAILLGKTVTTPLACFDPPATKNPWSFGHTPGGSSSGSAAALAACQIAGALGSQTGGSLCRPASYCGVCAMKPTFGIMPTDGVQPVSLELDHPGPMARNVSDLALLFGVLTNQPTPTTKVQAYTLGIPKGPFSSETSEELLTLFHSQVERLSQAGFGFVEVELPADFSSLYQDHYDLMAFGAYQTHKARFQNDPTVFPPKVSDLIQTGTKLTGKRIDQARQGALKRRQGLIQLLRGLDGWVLPGFHEYPPGCESTGVPRFHSPWSFLGWPEVSIAVEQGRNNLPVALQVVGRPHSDRALLAIAQTLSSVLGRPKLPPVGVS